MGGDIKVSVVIPAFNSAKTIRDTIQSVLAQTIPVLEVIVIDDGSLDQTTSIVKRLADVEKKIPIKLFSQPNSGPSAARNNGINHAAGTHIAFLDADDMWLPNKIELQLKCLSLYPDAAIVCGELADIIYDEDLKFFGLNLNKSLYKNPFYTSTVLINKTLMKGLRFDRNIRFSEDYRFFLQILSENQCYKINRQLTHYNNDKEVRKNSLSSKLWPMEKAELSNFKFLYTHNRINALRYFTASCFSLVKFLFRLLKKYVR